MRKTKQGMCDDQNNTERFSHMAKFLFHDRKPTDSIKFSFEGTWIRGVYSSNIGDFDVVVRPLLNLPQGGSIPAAGEWDNNKVTVVFRKREDDSYDFDVDFFSIAPGDRRYESRYNTSINDVGYEEGMEIVTKMLEKGLLSNSN